MKLNPQIARSAAAFMALALAVGAAGLSCGLCCGESQPDAVSGETLRLSAAHDDCGDAGCCLREASSRYDYRPPTAAVSCGLGVPPILIFAQSSTPGFRPEKPLLTASPPPLNLRI
jgi:hypothetical protein